MKILSTFFLSLLITLSLPMIFMQLAHQSSQQINKSTSFECGFNQMGSNRMTFSSQFFMIAILFLIFDLEITLILPLPIEETSLSHMLINMMILILFLTGGLLIEWKQGMLEWSK